MVIMIIHNNLIEEKKMKDNIFMRQLQSITPSMDIGGRIFSVSVLPTSAALKGLRHR